MPPTAQGAPHWLQHTAVFSLFLSVKLLVHADPSLCKEPWWSCWRSSLLHKKVAQCSISLGLLPEGSLLVIPTSEIGYGTSFCSSSCCCCCFFTGKNKNPFCNADQRHTFLFLRTDRKKLSFNWDPRLPANHNSCKILFVSRETQTETTSPPFLHTHTHTLSLSLSLCVSLCTTQNPKHHDSTTTTSYYPPLPQKSATLSQENKIKNSNKRTIAPPAVIIIVVVVTSNSTTKTTPMIKKQLRKTNKICRNLWDERRRSLCLFCLCLSLAVSVAVSSWCSAVSSRVHKSRN